MSELNINDLPKELLMKVFRYLDEVQWNNAALTCKLWNSLVESSCRGTLRLHYDRNEPPDQQRISFISTTIRKFHTIELYGSGFSKDDEILKILQRHGINVVKLCIREGHMSNPIVFAERLKLMPNLKDVYVWKTFFHDISEVPPIQVLPELKKLKEIVLFYSDHRIIKCFEKAKPTKLKVGTDASFKDCTLLVDFLKSQDNLTSLCVNAMFQSPSILVELGKVTEPIRFMLTELSISEARQDFWIDFDILKFLSSQAMSLKQLQMIIGFPSYVYQFVLANMHSLNTLSVLACQMLREKELYNRLKENRSVRTLILSGISGLVEAQDYKFIPNFLRILPNIHCLILPDVFGQDLLMVQNLSKLESISLRYIEGVSLLNVKFPNLKKLEIEYLLVKINWNEFTKFHPQLIELTIASIENESFLTSDDMDQITANAVNLQTLRLGVGFIADDRFFEIIRIRCRKLKKFELHKSCIPCGLQYNTHFLLRLCDDIKCSEYFKNWF